MMSSVIIWCVRIWPNLRGKLGAETRLEAVMASLRLGLLELR